MEQQRYPAGQADPKPIEGLGWTSRDLVRRVRAETRGTDVAQGVSAYYEAWTRKARKGGGGGLDKKSEKGGWRRPGQEKRERGVAAAWTRKARKGGGGGLDEKSEWPALGKTLAVA